LKDLLRGRSQLLVYHFMFGPDYAAGCPSCSTIADGFNGFTVHLANHEVMLWAVSRAPLAKLQAYRRRMGWSFRWASSFGSDFNFDFNVSFTADQQRQGLVECNYERGGHAMDATPVSETVAQIAAICGTDVTTYALDRPGMSAFVRPTRYGSPDEVRRGQGARAACGPPPALTSKQQQEARERRDNGATLTELAKSYNVGMATISRLSKKVAA
jgi:predicted dithiol-disulfide oxidoreductase (DUF899 family)